MEINGRITLYNSHGGNQEIIAQESRPARQIEML